MNVVWWAKAARRYAGLLDVEHVDGYLRYLRLPPVATSIAPEIRDVAATIEQRVRRYSMVTKPGLEFLTVAVKQLEDGGVAGEFVECGVWRGGAAAAMLLSQYAINPNRRRALHMFDSFEGMPPAQAIDGCAAAAWQANASSPRHFENCRASLDVAKATFAKLGLPERDLHFHKGWFADTIPQFVHDNPHLRIALLRLDGDWYASTKVCLDHLYPRVSENGIVVIDDYFQFDGCAIAVHEFLGSRRLPHRIHAVSDCCCAYFIKSQVRYAGT